MDNSDGLKAEAKALDACLELQRRHWLYKGYAILKAVRTNSHPEYGIRRLEAKKIDLIIVLQTPRGYLAVFVLQIKSTEKSFRRFCDNPKHRNIKCLLALKNETTEIVMEKLIRILEEAINEGDRKNRFFRRNIPLKLV